MSFLFERNFDDDMEKELGPKQAPSSIQTFSAAELEAIRNEAYHQGHAAGHAEGFAQGEAQAKEEMATSISAQASETLSALLPQLTDLCENLARHRDARERDLTQLTLLLAKRLLPEIEQQFATRRIKAFVRQSLTLAEGSEGIDITVPPHLADEIKSKLDGLAHTNQIMVKVHSNPKLSASGAHAQWRNGGAELCGQTLTKSLLEMIEHIAQSPDQDEI